MNRTRFSFFAAVLVGSATGRLRQEMRGLPAPFPRVALRLGDPFGGANALPA
jgi:hypothetical protein